MRLALLALLGLALQGCPRCASVQGKRVREPAVAGAFYPSEASALEAQVDGFLGKAKRAGTAPVRMVLVPHAGLRFSGQIAAEAFKQLDPGFERVVIIAANHSNELHYSGLSVDRSTHYRVPGLEVKVAGAAEKLLERAGFVDVPLAHSLHMIEIELPFLRAVNDRAFEIVPLIAGSLDGDGVQTATAALLELGDPRTVFVFSVDLSHHLPYEQAVALDRSCLDALARSDAQAISRCDTDGTQVLRLMNELSARRALTPRLLGYANSGDLSGERSEVVGYGAIAYEDRFELGAEEGAALVALARQALEARVRERKSPELAPELLARWPRLGAPRGAFVTLKKAGALRGCIGSLLPTQPLALDVIQNAIHAAVEDSRFPPVRADELSAISLSVSVLELPAPLPRLTPEALVERLGARRLGVILESQGRRSTFLPEVWEQLPEPESFLGQLCLKQGSAEGCWRDASARVQTYGSQHFSE